MRLEPFKLLDPGGIEHLSWISLNWIAVLRKFLMGVIEFGIRIDLATKELWILVGHFSMKYAFHGLLGFVLFGIRSAMLHRARIRGEYEY
jgi:hypothetical protein